MHTHTTSAVFNRANIHLSLRREFKLNLESSTDIFLPGFKVYVVDKDGPRVHKPFQTMNTVRGIVEGIFTYMHHADSFILVLLIKDPPLFGIDSRTFTSS